MPGNRFIIDNVFKGIADVSKYIFRYILFIHSFDGFTRECINKKNAPVGTFFDSGSFL